MDSGFSSLTVPQRAAFHSPHTLAWFPFPFWLFAARPVPLYTAATPHNLQFPRTATDADLIAQAGVIAMILLPADSTSAWRMPCPALNIAAFCL